MPVSPNSTTYRHMAPASPISSPIIRKETSSPLSRSGSDSFSHSQQSPRQSPHAPRRNPVSQYDRTPQSPVSYMERSPSPSHFDHPSRSSTLHTSSLPQHPSSSKLLNPYEMGRRSPRPDRSPSPLSFNYPVPSTLPRNFGFRQPGKWLKINQSNHIAFRSLNPNKLCK